MYLVTKTSSKVVIKRMGGNLDFPPEITTGSVRNGIPTLWRISPCPPGPKCKYIVTVYCGKFYSHKPTKYNGAERAPVGVTNIRWSSCGMGGPTELVWLTQSGKNLPWHAMWVPSQLGSQRVKDCCLCDQNSVTHTSSLRLKQDA